MTVRTGLLTLILVILMLLLMITQAWSQLSGTYTVGTGGTEDYTSLTNAGGLFDDMNTAGVSGNLTINITTDLVAETGNIDLNSWSGGHTMVIQPASATLKTITHSDCTNELIELLGVDNLTIDGNFSGAGRYLRFESACAAKPVIALDGDCQSVTLRNLQIASDNADNSSDDGGAVVIRDNQVAGSDDFTFYQNLVEDLSGSADLFFCLTINAPDNVGSELSGVVVDNNRFKNYAVKAVFMNDFAGDINGSVVRRNHMFADKTVPGAPGGWTFTAIQIESGEGHTIFGNKIGGSQENMGGSKMDVSFMSGAENFIIIRLMEDVSNTGTVNVVDSNVIRNISITGSTDTRISASMFRVEEGKVNVGTAYGNFIGDTTVDASTAATASIEFDENYNSSSHSFRFIYTSSGGEVNVNGNIMGGIHFHNTTSNGVNPNFLYSSSGNAHFQNNFLGGVINNIYKLSDGDIRAIYSNGENVATTISGNRISGITAMGDFDSWFYGIRAANGSGVPNISNNTIVNIQIGDGTLSPRMYGVRNENPDATIEGNRFWNLVLNSLYSGTQVYMIRCAGSGSTFTIRDNYIGDVDASDGSSTTHYLNAIYTSGSSDFIIDGNFVEDLSISSSSNSSYIRTFYINTATSYQLTNNVILIDNESLGNDIYVYGIYDNCSSGDNDIWHNTVDIRGSGSGTRRSACYYRTGSANRNIQNNLFNNRRSGGSGGHYAMYHGSSGGTMTCDYNLLYAEADVTELVRYSGDKDFSQWQGAGFGANSVNPSSPQNLVDVATGYQTTYAGNDIGSSALGVMVDHEDSVRPLGTGYDMGAFELATAGLVSPLPVELAYFDATCDNAEPHLLWATYSETNNDHFRIEYSIDGYDWDVVASVMGAGNSASPVHYQWIAPETVDGFYRLFQVDLDGQEEMLGLRSVGCSNDFGSCTPTLNAGNALSMAGCPSGRYQISWHDLRGRLVHQQTSEYMGAPISMDLTTEMESGIYLLTTFRNGWKQSIKVYKSKE